MIYTDECALVPQARIEAWQNKLAQIVQCIQPWWGSADHMPIWVQDYSHVRTLVESMERRVEKLAQSILPVVTANCRADSAVIHRIESELAQLQEIAQNFDQQLRSEIPRDADDDCAAFTPRLAV